MTTPATSTVAQALAEIEHDTGCLTPAVVVAAAKAKTHPLHDRFEWDDKIAGARYRLDQARELIRSVKIEVLNDDRLGPRHVRRYVSVGDSSGRAYHRVEEVLTSEDLRAQAFEQWEREVAALRARNRVMDAYYREWIAEAAARVDTAG